MRHLICALTVALAATLISGTALAEKRGPRAIYDESKASEVLKKYRKGYLELKGSNQFAGESINPLFDALFKCRVGAEKCQIGWDAARGKLDPKLSELLQDMLHIDRWGGKSACDGTHGQPDYICGKSGDKWTFTILGPGEYTSPQAIIGALYLLPFYNVKGAAEAVAKTISSNKHFIDLYDGGVRPINTLLGLSAKDQLPALLKAMQFTGPRGVREHMRHLLIGLLDWTLTPDQNAEIAKFCVGLFEDSSISKKDHAACVRYLGLIGTNDEDARAFIANWAGGGGDSWLHFHAVRAVAGLQLKDAKAALKNNLQRVYQKKTKRVRKGRKYKEVKTDTWAVRHNSVESAIALFGMKDKEAKKAIAYWTSFEDRGGSQEFVHSQGFRLLARDAAFADAKTRKGLHKILSKAFKKALKMEKSKGRPDSNVFQIALGLSHLGDKDAVKYLLEYIEGKKGRSSDIQNIFSAWGAFPGSLLHGSNSSDGIGRLPIGDTVSVKDAKKVVAAIEKKIRFWDKNAKSSGTAMLLKLNAQIYAVENNL